MKNGIIIGSLLCVVAICVGFTAGLMQGNRQQQEKILAYTADVPEQTEAPFVTEATPTPSFAAEQYLVSLSDNYIVVYKVKKNGETELLHKKSANTDTLRKDDYQALFKGIMVTSEQEALQLIEDYVS